MHTITKNIRLIEECNFECEGGFLNNLQNWCDLKAQVTTQAEAKEAGIRAALAVVEGRAKEYEALLDKGKGQHGQPGYVRDSTWDNWQGHHSEASQTATLLRALLKEGKTR